jgi:hypothetical protein
MASIDKKKLAKDIIKLAVAFGLGGPLATIRMNLLINTLRRYTTYENFEYEYIEKHVCKLHKQKYVSWRFYVFEVGDEKLVRVY